MLDIISIALRVALKLGQREVIWIQSKQPKLSKPAREHLNKSVQIALRNRLDRRVLKIDSIPPRQDAPCLCKPHDDGALVRRRHLHHIDIRRGARQAVELCDHETTEAVQLNRPR